MQAVFFDGKEIETMTVEEKEEGVIWLMKQEHLVVFCKPEGKQPGLVALPRKAAEPIADETLNFLKENVLIND